MADSSVETARRRELRRRKILENSEDRLRKLVTVDRTRPRDLNEGPNETPTDISNRVAFSKDASNNRDLNKNRHNFNSETTDEDEDDNYAHNTRSEQHGKSGNIQTLPKILTENKICSKAKLDSNRITCKPASSLRSIDFILQRKCLCVLLAILGRMLGCLLEGSSLTKGITSLFIILEVAFFSTELLSEREQRPQPHSVLFAALLLCGIRNATKIFQLAELLIKLTEDFSVFFFTFFMCHWWIEAIC